MLKQELIRYLEQDQIVDEESIEIKTLCRAVLGNRVFRGRKCYICKKKSCLDCGQVLSLTDRTDKVALVTGGRVKIGFETCLLLLRSGATVIATTRYANDAHKRYGEQDDYREWKDRLHIYEIDFLKDVQSLVDYVFTHFDHLDYLINNAAQTIGVSKTYINSWIHTIETVPPTEVEQVLRVNAYAPFHLIQGLHPLMHHRQAYIINVSAMEGKFNKHKTENHPHTNMAKAALNMLTCTIAYSFYTKYDIRVFSVDTGWVTIEEPLTKGQEAPLTCKQGAERVVEPIMNEREDYGTFLKDFKATSW